MDLVVNLVENIMHIPTIIACYIVNLNAVIEQPGIMYLGHVSVEVPKILFVDFYRQFFVTALLDYFYSYQKY